jgi:hypothetical protein
LTVSAQLYILPSTHSRLVVKRHGGAADKEVRREATSSAIFLAHPSLLAAIFGRYAAPKII